MSTLAEEAAAARSGAVFFDVSDRTQIELRGADRVKFLHNFCTQDIKGLATGQGCEAFLCNAMGRILGHVAIFAAEDGLWLDTVPGAEAGLLAHFDKYLIREDVELCGRSAELGELWLAGPQMGGYITQVLPGMNYKAPPAGSGQSKFFDWDGGWFWVRSIDWLGSPGWLISGPRDEVGALKSAFAGFGVIEGSAEVLEALRIEAGYPRYGQDLTTDNLAQEAARTERCISFQKGCYLGQEPIARLDALGHTNRELRRLRWEGTDVPAPGTALSDPESGQPAGVITSAAPIYDAAPPAIAAIAMIKTKWNSPGALVRPALDRGGAVLVLPPVDRQVGPDNPA